MIKQEYSMYEIITMTPGMASEVLCDAMSKTNPDKELIKNLIQHSWLEDVNVQNRWGETALMIASVNGHTEIVRMLLDRPEILVNVQDEMGRTALIRASENGHTEIVKMLLERPEILVNVQDRWGNTALTLASFYGYTEIQDIIQSYPNFKKT